MQITTESRNTEKNMHLPYPNNTGLTPREREKKKKDSKKLIKVPTIPEEAIKMENKSSYLGEDNSNQKQNKSMK